MLSKMTSSSEIFFFSLKNLVERVKVNILRIFIDEIDRNAVLFHIYDVYLNVPVILSDFFDLHDRELQKHHQ